jgi:ubiquinone/menaquinone biosynthesis C-methylase UbiE
MANVAASFSGSIPEYYDSCLGPAWFDPFAEDLVRRLPANPPGDVLELACGTGILTRRLRERLDPTRRLVASDLSKAMLDFARGKMIGRKSVDWREADAASLPFGDGEFGAVLCGFGVMFVPDKRAAMSEARRVLKTGGVLLFNVWDRIERNPHAAANVEVLESLFPGDEEIRFTMPFELYDAALLRQLLGEARFQEIQIKKKQIKVQGVSARNIAIGLIRGTPRSLLIEKRGVSLDVVIDKVTAALAKLGGADPYRGPANAVIVEARAGE